MIMVISIRKHGPAPNRKYFPKELFLLRLFKDRPALGSSKKTKPKNKQMPICLLFLKPAEFPYLDYKLFS